MFNRLLKKPQESAVTQRPEPNKRRGLRIAAIAAAVVLVICLALAFYWSSEPDLFDIREAAQQRAGKDVKLVTGDFITAALIEVATTLLEKPGGYLTNDKTPPSVFLDNIPNWEFGALAQVRDLARLLRNDFSRSQTQSAEDPDLSIADPQFHFDSDSWFLPSTEGEYRKGIRALNRYLTRLHNPNQRDARFFARADNLREWLAQVGKRLGNLSQRLGASVGRPQLNLDLSGEPETRPLIVRPVVMAAKTPWLEIDDAFYETRGATWALVHFLRAAELDFESVLTKKNALVSLRQIIRELEATQDTLWSPMVLNGSEFGFVANHSLIMASYISRANAALIDLLHLLAQG
jgi:hypothetical protein